MKKVLVIVSPSQFLTSPYIKSSSLGTDLITYNIDSLKYNVDYYDLDALLTKNGTNSLIKKIESLKGYDYILCNLVVEFYPSSYFKNAKFRKFNFIGKTVLENLHNNLEKENCLDKFLKTCEVFIKISNLTISSKISERKNLLNTLFLIYNSRIFASIKLLFLILKKLKENNKESEVICGGKGWDRVDFEKFNFKKFVDFIYFGKFDPETINNLLDKKEVSVFNSNKDYYIKNDPFKSNVYLNSDILNFSNKFSKKVTKNFNFNSPIPKKTLKNIEDLRIFYKEIFSPYNFFIKNCENKYIQQASLILTEGCVGKCAFCPDGESKLKTLPLEKIKEIIKFNVFELGYNSFFFLNDSINPTRKFAEDFCNWIIKDNIKIWWSDSCRFQNTDLDFFKMLYESGARILDFGVDSFDNDYLKYLNKNISTEEIEEGVINSNKAGIWNYLNFIFGMPNETDRSIKSTLDFIKRNNNNFSGMTINGYMAAPTSPFFKNPEKFNLNIKKEYTSMDSINCLTLLYEEEKKPKLNYNLKELEKSLENLEKNKGVGQHLIFALYDVLKTKEKVSNWVKENIAPSSVTLLNP